MTPINSEILDKLAALGSRFYGVDLAFRRNGTGWPAPWKARCIASKNERYEYRHTVFADTAEQAIADLLAAVESADTQYIKEGTQ